MIESNVYQSTATRRTHTLTVRGVEYWVNEWGDADAPPFFYLHGWADTGSTFQFVVDALSSRWRVIAPDWRGFGRSAHSGESYWFPDYLADLDELLAFYSPDSPVRLVGHSMGGNIGSLYAGTMPERVSHFVNIEGFGLPDSKPGDTPQRFRNWIESGRAATVFSRYRDIDTLARKIRSRSPRMTAAQANFVAREWTMEASDGEVCLRADPRHKLPNPVLYRRAEAEACWRCISAPTLLIYGEQSSFAGSSDSRASLPYPDSRLSGIAGAGHMIHFEAPAVLAGQIEDFFMKPL